MPRFIRSAILKWSLREVSEPDDFSVVLGLDWTGRSEKSFESIIDIGGGECVALLYPLSRIRVGIYKPSFISLRTMLVELAEVYFRTVELAASQEKEAPTKDAS